MSIFNIFKQTERGREALHTEQQLDLKKKKTQSHINPSPEKSLIHSLFTKITSRLQLP